MKKFELMALPYAPEALEPVISRETIGFHHGKVFNNAGQILNHEMYFLQFKPVGEAAQEPDGALAAQIEKQWGSVEAFKAEFEAKGVGLFGSGWVWLSADADGNLVITQEQGASNPVVKGLKPLLTFDVWEHAYYLDYQNRRAAHLAALWQIVDWKVIEKRLMVTCG